MAVVKFSVINLDQNSIVSSRDSGYQASKKRISSTIYLPVGSVVKAGNQSTIRQPEKKK